MQSRPVVDAMLQDIARPFPRIGPTIRHARVYRWNVGVPVFFPGYLRHLGQFRSGNLEGDSRLAVAGEYLYSPSAEGAVYSGERAAERLLARLVD
jgi:oxygen-dependent protoporphyrinogen oxidase